MTTLDEQVNASIVPEWLIAALAGLFGSLGTARAAVVAMIVKAKSDLFIVVPRLESFVKNRQDAGEPQARCLRSYRLVE